MDWLNSSAIDGLIGAFIGGGAALGGTFLSNWLSQRNEKKSKVREAKSKIISNIVIQYRNLERGCTLMLEININKFMIIAISDGVKSPWTIQQLEDTNNSMYDVVESIWKDNNIADIELVHNLAILQSHDQKTANAISDSINRFISEHPDSIDLTKEEAYSFFGKAGFITISDEKKNKALEKLRIIHNDILSKLGSSQLQKL